MTACSACSSKAAAKLATLLETRRLRGDRPLRRPPPARRGVRLSGVPARTRLRRRRPLDRARHLGGRRRRARGQRLAHAQRALPARVREEHLRDRLHDRRGDCLPAPDGQPAVGAAPERT
ncbi:MAG: hypothetical protein MZV65_32935 [Chromatiales bacterium]|nr:hypothetical protein [Chromatiales bacterium]